MFSLKDKNPETWSMLILWRENFYLLNKTLISFSVIGIGYATEQENRAVKVLGGIKGIVNNPTALDEYFFTLSEMGNVLRFLWSI